MRLLAVGLNHKSAPVEVRERLSFSGSRLETALRDLVGLPDIDEGVILSTCNRTEVYAVAAEYSRGSSQIQGFLEAPAQDPSLRSFFYSLADLECASHLFRVAAGLDSMILGEAQILGQVKDAFFCALEARTAGPVLSRLFRQAVETGKKVRNETEIGQNAVSVSYAAVELARKIFGTLAGKKVLIVGAGQMSELTAKNLCDHGASTVLVANRTRDKATELAERYGGQAVEFAELGRWLAEVDIVISSTGAPHVVIDFETVREAMRARRNRSLFLVDIAVPRDIEPRVNQLDNVYLYNVDDLESVVEANLAKREREVARAESIIRVEVAAFASWLAERQVVPVIRALRDHGEEIRQEELQKLFSRLPGLGEEERALIAQATRGMFNKLWHTPVVRLKEAAARDEGGVRYADVVRQLFGLDEGSGLEGPGLRPKVDHVGKEASRC